MTFNRSTWLRLAWIQFAIAAIFVLVVAYFVNWSGLFGLVPLLIIGGSYITAMVARRRAVLALAVKLRCARSPGEPWRAFVARVEWRLTARNLNDLEKTQWRR
jgi:hypothetical protein